MATWSNTPRTAGACAGAPRLTSSARSSNCATTSRATSHPSADRLARRLEVRIGRGEDALDRFEAGWNRLTDGRKLPELHVLTLEDLPRLLAALTPARWALLAKLRGE